MDDLQKAASFFSSRDDFLITTHEGPDADGLGAEVVLIKALRHLGKKARIVNASPATERYAFIDPEKLIGVCDCRAEKKPDGPFVLVVLDSADRFNLGTVSDALLDAAAELYAIDHHEPPKKGAISGLIDTTASSTCELVVRLAELLGAPLDGVSAEAAYAGIVYDTGSFIYPKTSASTFRTAIRLVEAGAVPNRIYQAMYESASLGALLLQKRVLSTLELHCGGKIAFQLMLKGDLEEAGAGYEEAEPLINIPLRSKQVQVSILMKESPDGKLRGSLRSKGAVNVSAIAQTFGGGGHKTAAGFKCTKGLAETKAEVLQKVTAALEAASIGCR